MKTAYRLIVYFLIVSLVTTCFSFSCLLEVSADDSYKEIKINGELFQTAYTLLNLNNVTYISAADAKNILGTKAVITDDFAELVTENNAALFNKNSDNVMFNNENVKLLSSAEQIDEMIYLPLKDTIELFGGDVTENGSEAAVTYVKENTCKGNGKKVYALYHTLRGNRENDGLNLNWDIYNESPTTKTGRTYSLYNSDLIDENDRNEVASINGGPLVGKGSDLDDDYLEYEVLSGKLGGLDGFALDFAFPEHTGTFMQSAMINQAKKYGFEVSIDFTDSSAVNTSWIENYRNDIKSKDARIEYVNTSMQYLLDNVYSSGVGSYIDGHPLIFFFGGGLMLENYVNLLKYPFEMPKDAKSLYLVRRYPFNASFDGDKVNFKDMSVWDQWVDNGIDAHTWCPDRVRPMDEENLDFDAYASFEDMKKYQEQAVAYWKAGKKANVNVACAMPGFDNRGCGAWGSGSLRGFGRYDGELYRWQWDYFNENKNYIDVVFVGSWNDFTEGHEIQPSVNNGYRELETTQEYSAKLKDIEYSDIEKQLLRVPQKIYEIRKKAEKYQQIGFDVSRCEKLLDGAALAVSVKNSFISENLIQTAEEVFTDFDKNIKIETIKLSDLKGDFTVTSGDPACNDGMNGIKAESPLSVIASDEKTGVSAKAVDGMISDYSSWITGKEKNEYTLDLSYEYDYEFTGIQIYSGTDKGNSIVKNGEIQYFSGDKWKTIPETVFADNNNSVKKLNFANIVTGNKLRFVCKDGEKGCTVREIIPYITYRSQVRAENERAENTPIRYKKGKNVALNSSISANGANSGYPVQNLIDGKISDDSRWIYTSSNDKYWAEMDFGEEYSIVSADLYAGKADRTWAPSAFYLEYDENGTWKTIPGTEVESNPTTNTDLTLEFDVPITTSKIRFVCTDGTNGCRMREIAVYTNGGIWETDKTKIDVRGKEIAGNATITTDKKTSVEKIKNINDNNTSDLSYWLSGTKQSMHFVEFDFDKKYDIAGTDIYSGNSDGTWSVKNVTVQYYNGSKWLDIKGGKIAENQNSDLKWNFDEVINTDKLRYVFKDEKRGVKLREIKIYSKSVEGENAGVYKPQNNIYLALPENIKRELNTNYFEGKISYDLLSLKKGQMVIKGCSDREPKKVGVNYGDYSVIAQLQTVNTSGAERQTVKLFKKNLRFDGRYKNNSDFIIWGVNDIKNLDMEFTVYKKIN